MMVLMMSASQQPYIISRCPNVISGCARIAVMISSGAWATAWATTTANDAGTGTRVSPVCLFERSDIDVDASVDDGLLSVSRQLR